MKLKAKPESYLECIIKQMSRDYRELSSKEARQYQKLMKQHLNRRYPPKPFELETIPERDRRYRTRQRSRAAKRISKHPKESDEEDGGYRIRPRFSCKQEEIDYYKAKQLKKDRFSVIPDAADEVEVVKQKDTPIIRSWSEEIYLESLVQAKPVQINTRLLSLRELLQIKERNQRLQRRKGASRHQRNQQTILRFDPMDSPPQNQHTHTSEVEISLYQDKRDTYSLKRLEKLMKANRTVGKLFQGQPPEDAEYDLPRLIVFVSEGMKRNYNRYGDLLTFDMMDVSCSSNNWGHQRFRVGVFAVNDNSMGVVLAGIAIILNHTEETYYEIFKEFFKIQEKPPSTFVTSHAPEIVNAVRRVMLADFIEMQHAINPNLFIKSLKEQQPRSKQRSEFAEKLKKLVDEKDREGFSFWAKGLFSKEERTLWFEPIMSAHPSLLYFGSKAYYGLKRDNNEELNKMLVEVLDDDRHESLMKFIRSILALQKAATEASEKQRVLKTPENEDEFNDDRLKQARRLIKLKVFYLLLDNVSRARKFEIAEEDKTTTIIRHKQQGTQYKIVRDRCECREMERTGMACPHLTKVTMINKKKKFEDLLTERWKVRVFV